MSDVIRHNPVERKTFGDWMSRFIGRQEDVGGNEYKNKVEFTFTAQPLINLISDWHVGHPTTQYKRIEDEVNAILGTSNSFVALLGDEIDNMNWNPGQFEQMEQTPEQIQFFWAVARELAENDRLLFRISGDHDDSWLMKSGFDLASFVRDMGVNTTTGPTHMISNVGDERYVGLLAHQLPGHSMYNKNHPQMRAERFGAGRGADFIASGHNHQKQISESTVHIGEGETQNVHYIALGPYKPTDSWLQKKGFPPQNPIPNEMFGVSVLLDGQEHNVYVSPDIVEANHSHRDNKKDKTLLQRLSPLKGGWNK
jgi:predicted phosphodiesterase